MCKFINFGLLLVAVLPTNFQANEQTFEMLQNRKYVSGTLSESGALDFRITPHPFLSLC